MTIGLSEQISNYTSQSLAFPFSGGTAALQFNRPNTVYASHTVAGAIAFTVNATGAVDGNETTVQLVASGANSPTFSSDFKNVSGSYDNRTGVVNIIQFKRIGTVCWYSIFQEYVPPEIVVPGAPALQLIEGAGTNIIRLVYDATLDPTSVPALSAFILSSGTISSRALAGQEIRLTLSANSASGVTLAYTRPTTNPLRDDSGRLAPSFAAQVVEDGPLPLVFSTLAGGITVDGNNVYSAASPSPTTTFALADRKIAAGQNGWVSFDVDSVAGNSQGILGFDPADTNKGWQAAQPNAGYDFGVLFLTTGEYRQVTNGVASSNLPFTAAVGDQVRLRRQAGVIRAERSNDGSPWAVLYEWPSPYTGDIFVNFTLGGGNTGFARPRIKNGVAK